ncbi:hypothetical protein HX056_00845 [Myroides odoratimimus]|uniref:hypothetical protein n=1 Tax=Myroides odoratimimus TaxID=76832 RepID=UPI0025791139|nr:hypothetical protein [Myroides odoratimimus]MDM1441885.1 hypothetical protein [Myroides odoratimimus]
MISEDLTTRIKCVLGHRYTSQILDSLDKKRIFNTQGKPFSRSYISQVVNGIRENLHIEEVILDMCATKTKNYKKIVNKKKQFLKEGL